MDGIGQTSILDAMALDLPSHCLKLKTVTASEVSPMSNGHPMIVLQWILNHSCLICLPLVTSPLRTQPIRFQVAMTRDLSLVRMSYRPLKNLSMEINTAYHSQIMLVTGFHLKMARICLLSRKIYTSQ